MEWDENLLVVIPCGSKARLRYHANKWNALSNVWLTDLIVKYASVTQLDRVPRYERGRHWFKSYRFHSLICATIPTGRGNALKMHQVSIRIRSGVPQVFVATVRPI